MSHRRWNLCLAETLVAAVVLMEAPAAFACTLTVTSAKWTGRVSVTGGPASDTGDVEIETGNATGNFLNTGFTVTTNAAGSGTVACPNITACVDVFAVKRNQVTFTGGVVCGPVLPVRIKTWFGFAQRGLQNQPVTVSLAQAVSGADGSTHLETWESGTQWTLRLDGTEATWATTSAPIVQSEQGDISASVALNLPSDVVVSISSDATPLTPNTLTITGLRINVSSSAAALHPQIGLNGTTNVYVDSGFLAAETSGGGFVPTTPIPLTSPVVPAMTPWTAGILGVLLLTLIILLLRRNSLFGAALRPLR